MTEKKNKDGDAPSGIKAVLSADFFVPDRTNRVKEGFRRLSIFCGAAALVVFFEKIRSMGDGLVELLGIDSALAMIGVQIGTAGAVAFTSLVTFIVVAYIVKTLGWVVEGFLGR